MLSVSKYSLNPKRLTTLHYSLIIL